MEKSSKMKSAYQMMKQAIAMMDECEMEDSGSGDTEITSDGKPAQQTYADAGQDPEKINEKGEKKKAVIAMMKRGM